MISAYSWLSDFSLGQKQAGIYIISNIQTNNIWLGKQNMFWILNFLFLEIAQTVVHVLCDYSYSIVSQLLMTFFEGCQVLTEDYQTLEISKKTIWTQIYQKSILTPISNKTNFDSIFKGANHTQIGSVYKLYLYHHRDETFFLSFV